jgi:hypothetical protein
MLRPAAFVRKYEKTDSIDAPRSSSTTLRTCVERFGGHLDRGTAELGDELGREQALTAGDDLAQLDVCRPEPLGGASQASGDVRRGCPRSTGTAASSCGNHHGAIAPDQPRPAT